MKPLPQNYDHKETEARWQAEWLENGVYEWDESATREETYVIDTPPPTVSGHLHMGHIFSYAQADFVARWQRMNGKSVFYPMGFDDNGLPTERLVEKEKKIQAHKFIQEHGREAFIDVCMGVSEQARKDFRSLFQSTALSVDWRQEYHTISPEVRRLSQLSFLDLMSKQAVERRLEPMLWDPVDQTAIAQAEVVDKEMESTFNDIYFEVTNADGTPLSEAEFGCRKLREDTEQDTIIWRNGRSYVVIGTTRPELIPACVGVFYNAEDARYAGLEGKKAITPLFGVKVKIYTDDSVEMEKGTGIMMCCTFGDEKDIEKWRKHHLKLAPALNKYAKIDFQELSQYVDGDLFIKSSNLQVLNGLKAAAARTKTLELLKESGDLIASKPIVHAVKCAERSGSPLEILHSPQWFVKVTNIKEELKSRSKACNWNPDWMEKRMEQWIDGLNWDWCISRQRYFGVPFPVWYSKRAGEEGKVLLADADQLPVNPLKDLPKGYSREEVEPDTDVMDTWATSSISPQINARALSEGTGEASRPSEPSAREAASHVSDSMSRSGDNRYTKLFPADLRPQAHEIIRTWAFYTLVKSHYHNDTIPWKNLMISGWCLAEDKTKMSKSKGNVVTPGDLLTEFSADVVRYWASTSRLGQDTAFSRDLLKIGKKLVNKLWNATKFAAIHLDKLPTIQSSNHPIICTLDKWILTRLHRTIAKATAEFERYEYAAARAAIEDFFWNDFCDNYLELVKKRVYDEANQDPTGQMSAVHTIALCLDAILRLFAPFLPHVTEELWSHIFPEKFEKAKSIHARGMWPKAKDYPVDDTATDAGIAALELLEAIRKAKSEKGVSIKWPITSMTVTPIAENNVILPDDLQLDVLAAGNVQAIHWKAPTGKASEASVNFHCEFTFAEQSDAA